MRRYITPFLFLSLVIVSCNHLSNSNYIVIDLVNHNLLPIEEILLSDIAESIQIISLETNDSVLLSTLSDIKIEKNRLYAWSSQEIYVFDLEGMFLNKISSRGRGPREYLNLRGLFPENDDVWIVDNSVKRALKFSSSNRYLTSFDFFPHIFSAYYHIESDSFIGFIPDNALPNTNMMLAFFDSTGLVDSILHLKPILEGEIVMTIPQEASFINHGSQIKFKHIFNDTIYAIRNNKLSPDMVVLLGARKANENARAVALKTDPRADFNIFEGMDKTRIVGENNRFVYLDVENSPVFYDKRLRKVHKWTFILPEDERIDLEAAKKFTPLCIDKNGYLIGQTGNVKEEDNPVIIVAKLME